jgi:hypothetical protein
MPSDRVQELFYEAQQLEELADSYGGDPAFYRVADQAWDRAFKAAEREGQNPPDQPPRPCDPERSPPRRGRSRCPPRAQRAAPPPTGNPSTRHHGRKPAQHDL